MRFYLGTDRPHWLRLVDIPLFVSTRVLSARKSLPRALAPWALDSGGFSELSMHGKWVTERDRYVDDVARYQEEIGLLDWAAPRDWMCEPFMIEKTGKSVAEHQALTVEDYLAIRDRGPFIPVLQGWECDDYLAHADLYASAGVDLAAEPVVGIGSVCRRGSTRPVEDLLLTLHGSGIDLHGFGLKITALRRIAYLLSSADSMAWSYRARRGQVKLPGCEHGGSCSHCAVFARQWRDQVVAITEQQQPALWATDR